MLIVRDNFLSPNELEWLQNIAYKKSQESYNIATKGVNNAIAKFYTEDKTAWDFSYNDINGDLTMPSYILGNQISSIVNQISTVVAMHDDSLTKQDLVNLYFMYQIKGYEVPKHKDRRFPSTTEEELSKIYKAFLFCNKDWNKEWGGSLCFNHGSYLPIPNRLIIYSNDEGHWVEKVTEKVNNNLRIIFGLRFRKEKNE